MDPEILQTLVTLAALIMSIIMHEVAHGYMANALGDPTARLAGRLTLNPVKHADPLGSIIIPAFLYFSDAGLLFGWAKPVPYNPYNLKNKRWGEALVAIAGPSTNMLLALIFAGIIRFSVGAGIESPFLSLASYIVYINVLLACFNMIPFPPLDGSKVLAAILPYNLEMAYRRQIEQIEQYGVMVSFAFLFVFMTFLWKPFSAVVDSVVRVLIGV
jgi:Zn-dependent protease